MKKSEHNFLRREHTPPIISHPSRYNFYYVTIVILSHLRKNTQQSGISFFRMRKFYIFKFFTAGIVLDFVQSYQQYFATIKFSNTNISRTYGMTKCDSPLVCSFWGFHFKFPVLMFFKYYIFVYGLALFSYKFCYFDFNSDNNGKTFVLCIVYK